MQGASAVMNKDFDRTEREHRVAVVGLGKIGLPLAIQYAQHEWRVTGCDTNPEVVETVNAGRCHVHEEPGLDADVADAVRRRALVATSDTTAAVRDASVVVVIVPVAVDDQHTVDFRAMTAASTAIGKGLHPGTLVVYETTLPVGTTSGLLRGILEDASQLTAGKDFFLAYSPERVSSGHIMRDLATYPKVVGGINQASTTAAVAFYRSVLNAEVIEMDSTDHAEFVKLIETTYRDVNIALANEYARFADEHGLDVTAAISAANTQPYSHIHQPGLGVGGHCIPVYPYFLLQGAAQGLTLPRSARLVNDAMADYAAERLEAEIGSLAGKSVLLLGIAYRGDVRETAFSSARLIQSALSAHGATVYADDPLYTAEEIAALGYMPLTEAHAGDVDAMILQASHSAYRTFDFRRFANCQVFIDGRRGLARQAIEALGMRYIAIGDGHKNRTRQLTRSAFER